MSGVGRPGLERARCGWVALLLVALALPGLGGPPGAGAEPAGIVPTGMPYDSTRGDSVGESALHLSWGAPWGMPGARRDIALSCADTSRVDTLYLSIETGRDLPRLYGMYARLSIRPLPGDSLGSFWGFGAGGANRGGLLAQMDPDDTFPCARPWVHSGMGGIAYEFDPGHGEIVVVYAVRPEDAAPVSGRTNYCLGRLLLRQTRCWLGGSRQPVCIEWWEGGYTGGGPDIVVRKGEGRFASVNSPDGSVCESWRRAGRVGTWRPTTRAAVPPAESPRPAAPADTTRR